MLLLVHPVCGFHIKCFQSISNQGDINLTFFTCRKWCIKLWGSTCSGVSSCTAYHGKDDEDPIIRWTWRKASISKFGDWRVEDCKPNNYFFQLGVFFGMITALLWSPTEHWKLENSPSVAVICGPNCSHFQECAKALSHSFVTSCTQFSKPLGSSVSQSHCWCKSLILLKTSKGNFETFCCYLSL